MLLSYRRVFEKIREDINLTIHLKNLVIVLNTNQMAYTMQRNINKIGNHSTNNESLSNQSSFLTTNVNRIIERPMPIIPSRIL
jgi:hypothetical protein